MPAFEAIASTTLSSDTASVTFSSIPATYEHLQLRLYTRDTQAVTWDWVSARFNSDTGQNYTYHYIAGDASAASAAAGTSQTNAFIGLTTSNSSASNCFGVSVVDILDYASTNKLKTIRSITSEEQNNSSGRVYLFSGLWLSTSAINTILIYPTSANWKAGSVFSLYGFRSE